MDQKPNKGSEISERPEETTGVPKEMAGEVREDEEAIKRATGDVVPPPPLARRKRAWEYWTS